jgi:hypothetical protein
MPGADIALDCCLLLRNLHVAAALLQSLCMHMLLAHACHVAEVHDDPATEIAGCPAHTSAAKACTEHHP